MKECSKYVGLDVHKETIAVSMAEASGGEVRYFGEIANTPEAVAKLARQLSKGDARLSFCYEAGACGYGVYRQLRQLKHECMVVAPSLIPKKAGDRVKTDRRDSLSLARLHRAHELTAVWVPEGAQEALRDLTRAREDMKHLQRQSKQRLLGFLLHPGAWLLKPSECMGASKTFPARVQVATTTITPTVEMAMSHVVSCWIDANIIQSEVTPFQRFARTLHGGFYMSTPTTVPVVDLAPFIAGSPEGKARVVEEVRRACEEIGFLAITGHGVSDDLVRRIRAAAVEFFALTVDQKVKIKRPSQEISRGYNRMADQALAYSLGTATPPDLQESFAFGQLDVPPGDPYYQTEMGRIFFAPNLWPEQPADLRESVRAYHSAMASLAETIMRIFALALNLDENFFSGKIDRAISLLRIIHYPGQEKPPSEGQLRCGAHTDYGTLTILYGDDSPGGLQVQGKGAGEWVDVHPAPNSFVVNIGDLMARWTNDRWVSTLHRVVNPPREFSNSSRISMPYFHQPNYDCLVDCLPTCLAPGARAKYSPITSGGNWLSKHMKARHMSTDYDALAKLAV